MISLEEFKEIYGLIHVHSEFEFEFLNKNDTYMIIKYDDSASFQRCGDLQHRSGETYYESLDILLGSTLVDGVHLEKDWGDILEIVVNCSFVLSQADDIAYIKETYK